MYTNLAIDLDTARGHETVRLPSRSKRSKAFIDPYSFACHSVFSVCSSCSCCCSRFSLVGWSTAITFPLGIVGLPSSSRCGGKAGGDEGGCGRRTEEKRMSGVWYGEVRTPAGGEGGRGRERGRKRQGKQVYVPSTSCYTWTVRSSEYAGQAAATGNTVEGSGGGGGSPGGYYCCCCCCLTSCCCGK